MLQICITGVAITGVYWYPDPSWYGSSAIINSKQMYSFPRRLGQLDILRVDTGGGVVGLSDGHFEHRLNIFIWTQNMSIYYVINSRIVYRHLFFSDRKVSFHILILHQSGCEYFSSYAVCARNLKICRFSWFSKYTKPAKFRDKL